MTRRARVVWHAQRTIHSTKLAYNYWNLRELGLSLIKYTTAHQSLNCKQLTWHGNGAVAVRSCAVAVQDGAVDVLDVGTVWRWRRLTSSTTRRRGSGPELRGSDAGRRGSGAVAVQ